MKKNKIWLFILIGFLTLCVNNRVMAADGVIGFVECKYKISVGKDKMDTNYVNNGVMSFYYSEVAFKDNDLSNSIFVKNKNYPDDFTSATGLGTTNCKESCFSSGLKTKETSNLIWSFKDSYAKNNSSCPKYMVLKDGGKSQYIPYFANDKEYYCGDDLSRCPVIGALNPTGERFLVNGNEKEWKFTSYGEGACDQGNLKLYFSGKKLRGEIKYPSSSSFYEKSAKKSVSVDVRTYPMQEGSTQIKIVYELLKYNAIREDMFIRGDSGNEKVEIKATGKASGTCTIKGGIERLSIKENCDTYEILAQQSINSKQNNYKYLKEQLDTGIANYVKESNNKFQANDYSGVSDVNSLVASAEAIHNLIKEDGVVKKFLNAYEEYNKSLTENYDKACIDAKTSIENLQKDLASDNEKVQEKIEALNGSLESIKARLEALGKNAEAATVGQYLEGSNEIIQELKRYYAITKATNLLSGNISLDIREGCAIITSDFKEWLIQLLNIVKIVALVLTVILSMLDFFKGVASGDADAMKKVTKNFSRRLIAVVILFLLPVLIEFILNLVNIVGVDANNPLCGIK